jgi:hypothetical protein
MVSDKLDVLFDLNILLDVLQVRAEYYDFSARLLANAEMGQLQGWLASHTVTTLFYLVAQGQIAGACARCHSQFAAVSQDRAGRPGDDRASHDLALSRF